MSDTTPNSQPGYLPALEESIEHWERLASGNRRPGEYIGSVYCALCTKFIHAGCVGCPVYARTGHAECATTPYGAVSGHVPAAGLRVAGLPEVYKGEEFKRLAKLELDFLCSLLPVDHPKYKPEETLIPR